MEFQKIDMDTWNRKETFLHYWNQVPCSYSVTAELDVTSLRKTVVHEKLKFYPVVLYLLTRLVNSREEFRMAVDAEGMPGFWKELSPCYTVFHPETETFSCLWSKYKENFSDFYREYENDMATYGTRKEFFPKSGAPSNLLNISMLPWIHFTAFELELHRERNFLLPIFTLGKWIRRGGAETMPVSIRVHHAACDGFHVARLFEELQKQADSFACYL